MDKDKVLMVLIAEESELSSIIKEHSKRKARLRRQIAEMAFPEHKTGINKYEANGFKLKIAYTEDYKVTSEIAEHLTDETREAIRWKPELNKRKFDALSDEKKKTLVPALEVRESIRSFETEIAQKNYPFLEGFDVSDCGNEVTYAGSIVPENYISELCQYAGFDNKAELLEFLKDLNS